MIGGTGETDPPMLLDYFSSFNVAMRQQRALLKALAQWQLSAGGELGEYGLSVTAEVTNPRSCGSITVQFSLHHQAGGCLQSGAFTIDTQDPADPRQGSLDWLAHKTTPLLQEFLLPGAPDALANPTTRGAAAEDVIGEGVGA
jgi:hypothetical protein